MNPNLDDRIDELERRLQALQAELQEVRALAQAPAVATAQTVPAPTGDARAALRALAKDVRIAVRDGDAASLRDYAAEAERLSPADDPAWAAYARELAAYARSVAGPEPVTTRPTAPDVRPRLRVLAETIRAAESDGNASLLRDIAREASQLASTAADSKWRAYALQLAEYAEAAATRATRRRAAASAVAAAASVKRESAPTAAAADRAESQAPERPRRRSVSQLAGDWDLLGARGMALAGGVVTLLGIVFFFVLATNRGWIGPVARVSLGAGASVLVFTAGLVIHHRYGQLHAALAACGAGIAGGYATLAAATILYDLLPAAGALVAATGIAGAGVVVALAWSSQSLAALGFLGAALSPAALALDEGVSAAGTAFAAVVFAALAAVTVRRGWDRLLVAGATVTMLQTVWLVADAPPEDAGARTVTAVVIALLIGAAAAWQLATSREGVDGLAAGLTAAAVGLSLGSTVQLYPEGTSQGVALLVAAAGLGLATALLVVPALDLAYVLGAGALLLAGVATTDFLAGTSIAVVFAAQSLLASAIAHRLRERRFQLGAYVYLGLSLGEALVVQGEWGDGLASGGTAALALAASGLAALAAGVLAPVEWRRHAGGTLAVLEPFHAWLGRERVNLRAAFAVGAFALAALALSDVLSGMWLVVGWSAAGAVLAVAAARLGELRLHVFALAAALLAVQRSVVLADPIETEFAAGAAAAIALVAASSVSLLVGLLTPRRQRGIARLGPLADVERALTSVADARVELRALLVSVSAALVALATASVLSGTWLAVAAASASLVLTVAAHRLGELRLVPYALAAAALAAGHALALDAPLVPALHPELSAGLAGAAAVAAAAAAAALAALLLPSAQGGIRWLGDLAGPELPLRRLVERRTAVRSMLVGFAGLLALGAAGLALVDLLGDAGHVVTVVLWSASGLFAVALGARRRHASAAWVGAGVLVATLIKVVGYDWSQLGNDQGAAELLVSAAAILAAGWLVRALSPSPEPIAVASAAAAGVSLVSTIAALDQLVASERPAGAAMLAVAAVYGALAAAAQRQERLRNLATVMWVPGLIALLISEALLLQDRNIAVAYAATAVALAATARTIVESRLQLASLVVLGGTTLVTLIALTPPTRLLEASEHPGTSGWTIAACAGAWAALAALEPRLRERLGWLAAALGLYTASLTILEVAERVSSASVQTDFERGHTAVSALWGAVGLGLLVAGLLRDSRGLRLGGLALFGISLAKLFLYDLSALSSVTRAFSFLAVGGLLLAGGFVLQKLSRRLDQAPPASAP
jgi:uncharacterized membrane protein